MFRCSRRVLNFLIRTNDNVSLNRLFSRGRNECDRCQSLRFQGNGLVAQEVGECKDGLRVVDYETEIGRFTTEILDTFRFDGASKCYRKILRISYKDCYQRGSPCQDPAGNRTARRPPDHRKETQTAVVWSCLPFIRSDQNHLARHSERGKKTRQTEEEVGRQPQGMDRPGVRRVPEGSGEQGKVDETGCEIICGAPTTLAVKGLMMMMMMHL